jgi:hypothetical protein
MEVLRLSLTRAIEMLKAWRENGGTWQYGLASERERWISDIPGA